MVHMVWNGCKPPEIGLSWLINDICVKQEFVQVSPFLAASCYTANSSDVENKVGLKLLSMLRRFTKILINLIIFHNRSSTMALFTTHRDRRTPHTHTVGTYTPQNKAVVETSLLLTMKMNTCYDKTKIKPHWSEMISFIFTVFKVRELERSNCKSRSSFLSSAHTAELCFSVCTFWVSAKHNHLVQDWCLHCWEWNGAKSNTTERERKRGKRKLKNETKPEK